MKAGEPKQIVYYVTLEGKIPFQLWFDKLKDKTAQARVLVRLERLKAGNPGDYKGIGMEDAYELRLAYGPGYRLYTGQASEDLVVLLCAGDKSSQSKDIEQAKAFWADYKQREAQ